MTGLMFHRPGDHIKYLIDCLQKVQDKGQDAITWSSFVDMRRNKTPLPPIDKGRPGSKGSSRPTSRTRTPAKGISSYFIERLFLFDKIYSTSNRLINCLSPNDRQLIQEQFGLGFQCFLRPTLKIFLFLLTRPCFTCMGRSV